MNKFISITLVAIVAACGSSAPVVSELDQKNAAFAQCKKGDEINQIASPDQVAAACFEQVYNLKFAEQETPDGGVKCKECLVVTGSGATLRMTKPLKIDLAVPVTADAHFELARTVTAVPAPSESPKAAPVPAPTETPSAKLTPPAAAGKKDDVGDLPDFDLPDPPKAKAKGK